MPLMIAAALAVTAVVSVRVWALPILTTLAGMFPCGPRSFFYTFFPYTRVKLGPALLDRLVAAILLQLAQWGYVRFQVGAANYKAIYGALATVPIFLVWTYLAWAIILFGAEVTAAVQRGADFGSRCIPSRSISRAPPCCTRFMRLAEQQYNEEPPLQFQDLAHPLGLAPETLQPVVDGLESGGFVVEVPSSKGSKAGAELHLVRAPGSIKLADALAAVTAGDNANLADPRVAAVMQRIASAQRQVLESMTLADLMRVQPAMATAPISTELKRG